MSYDPDADVPDPTPDPDGDPGRDPGPDPDPAGTRACSYTAYEYREPVDREDLPATGEDAEGLAADVWAALYGVEDPEMPVSVVDLGLVYDVAVDSPEAGSGDAESGDADVPDDDPDAPSESGDPGATVTVDMTLTYTGCPAREMLLSTVEDRVRAVEGVGSVDLRLVWSPEWSLEMVTEDGRERLREFGLSV